MMLRCGVTAFSESSSSGSGKAILDTLEEVF
jgi:hypothetical protein